MIALLAGREGKAQSVRADGKQGRVDRTGVSPQRRVRRHSVVAVPECASRAGASDAASGPDRLRRGR